MYVKIVVCGHDLCLLSYTAIHVKFVKKTFLP
jgi:hypothetical protein